MSKLHYEAWIFKLICMMQTASIISRYISLYVLGRSGKQRQAVDAAVVIVTTRTKPVKARPATSR